MCAGGKGQRASGEQAAGVDIESFTNQPLTWVVDAGNTLRAHIVQIWGDWTFEAKEKQEAEAQLSE